MLKIFTMDEAILSVLSGLPTASVLLYVWIVSNSSHNKEREAWRGELQKLTEAFNLINNQIQKLDFIIENYVIKQGDSAVRK